MYKRTWTKKFGKSEIFTKEDSFCQKVEIDMVKLADGQTKTYSETDKVVTIKAYNGRSTNITVEVVE